MTKPPFLSINYLFLTAKVPLVLLNISFSPGSLCEYQLTCLRSGDLGPKYQFFSGPAQGFSLLGTFF